MEEEIINEKVPFKIVEKDFILSPISEDNYSMFNLTFMKKVKKQATGKYEIEPGKTAYGMTLSHALQRIIKHRTAKKFENENITLIQYLKELNKSYKEIIKLCKDCEAKDLDSGD